MKLVASVTVPLSVIALVEARSGGEIQVLGVPNDEAQVLVTYDEALREVSREPFEYGSFRISSPDRAHWMWTHDGPLRIGFDGVRSHVNLPENPKHLAVVAIASDGDSHILALDSRSKAKAPLIMRVDSRGAMRWATELRVPRVDELGLASAKRPNKRDIPQTWLVSSPALAVGKTSLLASFAEMPRTGIGLAYVLSLNDGSVQYTTRAGPISEVASLADDRFLVGFQGYGAFVTFCYAPDGSVENSWPTHGIYLTGRDDVRVIEMTNVRPSKARVGRLVANGTVEHGSSLTGYYTSRPLDIGDETYFVRDGRLQRVQGIRVSSSCQLPNAHERCFGPAPIHVGDTIYCATKRPHPTRYETELHAVLLR